MSSLLDVRAGYVTALQTLSGVNVYTHGGDFDLTQVKAFARHAPALIIFLARYTAAREAGYPVATATWGLVAFTKEEPGVGKAESVIALTELASAKILGAMAGSSSTQPVGSAKKALIWRNSYSPALLAEGIALWAAEWEQKIDLVQPIAGAAPDLVTIGIQWDVYAPPGSGDGPDGTIDAEDLLDDLDQA